MALKRLGGRQALYDRLVKSFIADAPAELDALAGHLAQGRVGDAARVLHTLRGLAGSVGGSALAAFAGVQEHVLPGGAERVDMAGLRAALRQTLDALGALSSAAPSAPSSAPDVGADPGTLLRQLRVLLAERNMRSVTAAEQLAGVQVDGGGEELAALVSAVAKLDFSRALKACDDLLARLGPP